MTKPIKVGFKRLTKDAIIPTKAHESDSGFDLYVNEDAIIRPNETKVISTGIAVQLPEGYEAQVRPRSGVTSKTKLRVQLGTIDNDYAGDIGIIVDNISENRENRIPGYMGVDADYKLRRIDGSLSDLGTLNNDHVYEIRKGDRIAQLVVQELPKTEAVEVKDLSKTERGGKGFGSSGV